MALFFLTLGGMAIVMAIMAVGPVTSGPTGESLACATCPRRKTEVDASSEGP